MEQNRCFKDLESTVLSVAKRPLAVPKIRPAVEPHGMPSFIDSRPSSRLAVLPLAVDRSLGRS